MAQTEQAGNYNRVLYTEKRHGIRLVYGVIIIDPTGKEVSRTKYHGRKVFENYLITTRGRFARTSIQDNYKNDSSIEELVKSSEETTEP
ncbi:hypothetical protein COV18_02640 [Candidatus Woesearchaeota archaeon CG10_big_fil_rev_8_21_14_0_10_37_12]|nr:MAG: hypothetical protein COV18_02640 [Candidatus Woesearchaeota archaeon CG10_big_fil_rev_8_21_14_0_10_37_12]